MSGLADVLRPQIPPAPPAGARRITTDEPIVDKEPNMPRGVYDRTKKGVGGGDKPKRKYTKRSRGAEEDVHTLATEAAVAAASHLAATVREEVELGDNRALISALRAFEVAEKILGAVK